MALFYPGSVFGTRRLSGSLETGKLARHRNEGNGCSFLNFKEVTRTAISLELGWAKGWTPPGLLEPVPRESVYPKRVCADTTFFLFGVMLPRVWSPRTRASTSRQNPPTPHHFSSRLPTSVRGGVAIVAFAGQLL